MQSAQANVVDLHGATLTDPTTVNPVEIKGISILATYIEGRQVYGKG